MEQKPLKDLILEGVESKGLSLDKVAQLTEIPKHYIEVIFSGEWPKLPAAPYARGYFKKIEVVLNFEENRLWNLYKEETSPQSSGAQDKLPENRYAIKTKNRKWLWPALIVIIIGVYVSFNFDRLLGLPNLNITSPLSATVITRLSDFTISGNINSQDKLYINGEEIYIDKAGQFRENYSLQPGVNTFELLAKKFLGQEIKVVKQIIYQVENDE